MECVLDLSFVKLCERDTPFVIPWPDPDAPNGLVSFETADDWRSAVTELSLNTGVPYIVRRKYFLAQKLYLLGWNDGDIIKAGELIAMTALELALMDCYGAALPKKKRSFSKLLKHMVECDGLSNAAIPMAVRCKGNVMAQVTGEVLPSLTERRNLAAHGNPFDGWPVGGLLELVRDLINYAYRNRVAVQNDQLS